VAQDRLLLNGGAGVFALAPPGTLPADSDPTHAVAFGDLDGDGDLDMYLGNAGTPSAGQDRVYRQGVGGFTDVTASSLPPLLDETYAVALGDVDGDGDLDVLVGNTAGAGNPAGGQDRLLRNGGTGAFTDATAGNVPSLIGNTFAVSLGDVDEDGDLDAFVANYWQQSRLYVNDGTGSFSDATTSALPSLVDFDRAVALADLDGDGDLDAFAGVTGRERVYRNLARQLSWRGIPRVGKPVTLDISGPPVGAWLLAASDVTASLPLPPFGTLRLFPLTTFVVAGGALDPQGRTSVSFPVPASPALVGFSLYWQALVGPPFRFTNLEVTTVTGL